MPICQVARSAANITPAATMAIAVRGASPVSRWRLASASPNSSGSGRNSRQKAAATGPESAIRTDHGPIASARLPTISAAR